MSIAPVFIDANVIIDFLDAARPRHKLAVRSLSTLLESGYTPVVTEDLLTTIYYVVKDKIKIIEFFEYILKEWIVVPFGQNLLEKTISDCRQTPNIDFEDRVQGYAALRENCRFILTSDRNFSAPSGLPCSSMEELLAEA
ncbi:type II toxin-antitoxin system VapC family toxin [Spirochaeta dissipatitropha]